VFVVNVPIVLIAGLAAVRVVRPDRDTGAGRLDIAGIILGALTLSSGTFAVIHLGHSGVSTTTVTAALIACLALAGFLLVESTKTDPMLPLALFRKPAFSTANGVAGAMNLGTLGLLFLLTLFLQTVQQRSALLAGVAVLPLFLPLSLLAPLAGRVTGRLGPKPMMITGLAVAAAGVALLATWDASTAYGWLLPPMLAWGAGLGLLTPAVVAAAIAATPATRSGLASGVNKPQGRLAA